MESITIQKDGSRTVVGTLAHKLAYGSYNVQFFKLSDNENYRVWEFNGDTAILRAAQGSLESAQKYMNNNRVLVIDLR